MNNLKIINKGLSTEKKWVSSYRKITVFNDSFFDAGILKHIIFFSHLGNLNVSKVFGFS